MGLRRRRVAAFQWRRNLPGVMRLAMSSPDVKYGAAAQRARTAIPRLDRAISIIASVNSIGVHLRGSTSAGRRTIV